MALEDHRKGDKAEHPLEAPSANIPDQQTPVGDEYIPPSPSQLQSKLDDGDDMYLVKVYVSHGYYEYEVVGMDKAMGHAHAIMASGVFRNPDGRGGVEFFKAHKVKVVGANLDSEYPAVFKRT